MFIASLPSGLWGCCEQIFWLAYYLLPLLPLLLYLNYKRFCFSCLFIYKISYISPWELCYISIEQNSSRWQPLLLLLQLCNFLVPYSMALQLLLTVCFCICKLLETFKQHIYPAAMRNRDMNCGIYFSKHSHLLWDYPNPLQVFKAFSKRAVF